MGHVGRGLEATIPSTLEAAGLVVHRDRHRQRLWLGQADVLGR